MRRATRGTDGDDPRGRPHLDTDLLRDVVRALQPLSEANEPLAPVAPVADQDHPRARPPSLFGVVARAGGTSLMTEKATLIAFCRVIEEESLSDLYGAHVFGCFQRQDFYELARSRWREIAAGARSAFVFADFASGSAPGAPGAVEVPLDPTDPLRREWSVVVDRPFGSMAMSALERDGQEGVADRERLFDSAWTTDPVAVRKAARICARTAQAAGSESATSTLYELSLPLATAQPDTRLAQRLLDRLLERWED